MRRRLILAIAVVAAAYAVVVLLLWWQQDRLVFPAAGRPDRPIDVPGARTFTLPGLDGVPFRAVECAAREPRAVLVFFVGNGEDLCSAARQAAQLAAYGLCVIAPEYPGYGASAGTPGVGSLFAAADAAAAFAEQRARELGVPFLAGGSSLGTFCAVHTAAQGRASRLLLRAPPTSMVETASRRFWWLPVALLLRHRFDSVGPAAAVRCPVLIVHGDRDEVVPLALGERLRAEFAGPTELIVVPGAGHNDLSLDRDGPVGARVLAFLRAP